MRSWQRNNRSVWTIGSKRIDLSGLHQKMAGEEAERKEANNIRTCSELSNSTSVLEGKASVVGSLALVPVRAESEV
jgi:hypothetical protein